MNEVLALEPNELTLPEAVDLLARRAERVRAKKAAKRIRKKAAKKKKAKKKAARKKAKKAAKRKAAKKTAAAKKRAPDEDPGTGE